MDDEKDRVFARPIQLLVVSYVPLVFCVAQVEVKSFVDKANFID